MEQLTYTFQVFGDLDLDNYRGRWENLVCPLAQYLVLVGNIAAPDSGTNKFKNFLVWASARFDKVWFVPGRLERGKEALIKQQICSLSNVKLLNKGVDMSMPGLMIVGSTDGNFAWTKKTIGLDSILISYKPPPDVFDALEQMPMKLFYNLPPRIDLPACATQAQRRRDRRFDSTFYHIISISPLTFNLDFGQEAVPVSKPCTILPLQDIAESHHENDMCLFCHHSGHVKQHCPLFFCTTSHNAKAKC